MGGGIAATLLSNDNLEKGFVVLGAFSILIGLIIGGTQKEKPTLLKIAVPTLSMNLAFIIYFVVRAIVDYLKCREITDSDDPEFSICFHVKMQTHEVSVMDNLIYFGGLGLILIFGTYFLILFSARGAGPISKLFLSLYSSGPEKIEKVNKILIGIGTVITTFISIWALFSQ